VFHRPAPLLGQHNDYVPKELLGLFDVEVARLLEASVVYERRRAVEKLSKHNAPAQSL